MPKKPDWGDWNGDDPLSDEEWRKFKYGNEPVETLSQEQFVEERGRIFAAIQAVVDASKSGLHTFDKHVVGAILYGAWIHGPVSTRSDIDIILLFKGSLGSAGNVRTHFKDQMKTFGITREVEIYSLYSARSQQDIDFAIKEERALLETKGYQLFT